MSQLFSMLSHILQGQTVARVLMNRALGKEILSGLVVDVGGGRNPDYFSYLKHAEGVRIEAVDASLTGIDLECDPLPYAEGTVDTVLLCNVLEHIYHHTRLLAEIARVLRPGGRLIGFVPFWVGYHPDPHDYFRYTKEALDRLLPDAGFVAVRITPLGGGPVVANYNTLMLSLPKLIHPLLYLGINAVNAVFVWLHPKSRERNPLGYLFTALKP
jgi:SAM-dependent methyltransferase